MRILFVFCLSILAACADRIDAPILPEATQIGTPISIYVGTTRLKENGVYGIGRSPQLTFMNLTVSLPPNREAGSISYGRAKPKPEKDFVLASMEEFPSSKTFTGNLRRDLRKTSSNGGHEVTVYVHGFNNSFAEAAFRMAQLSHDLELEGPVVSYAWPSRGNALGYEYDADSALFARDGLVQLLHAINRAGNNRIVLVGHSMGGRLVMETLRELELTRPGWAAKSMAGVLLISPDVNVDVFRSQTAKFTEWPQPFVIFSSRKDRFLRIAAALRGEPKRLGNLDDVTEISDLPIAFIDVTAFDDGDIAHHFVAGSSGSFLQLIKSSQDLDDAFLQGQTSASISVLGSGHHIGRSVTLRPQAEAR
ncbi:MAG: alpha/beta fold hydrolase [Aliishimia sp.]